MRFFSQIAPTFFFVFLKKKKKLPKLSAMSDYAKLREAKMARNAAILASLGLGVSVIYLYLFISIFFFENVFRNRFFYFFFF